MAAKKSVSFYFRGEITMGASSWTDIANFLKKSNVEVNCKQGHKDGTEVVITYKDTPKVKLSMRTMKKAKNVS